MAAISRQKKFEDELKLEKAKLEQRIKYEKKLEESRKPVTSNTSSTTKLPKLVISKFNGTYTDWTRFWQQYEASIGAADIPNVTKFSYLKELLEPKIRGLIEGLPLSSEGFERAKNILKTKYGKESEIYLLSFVETPRKFIIAELSIRKLGSSSVLIIFISTYY